MKDREVKPIGKVNGNVRKEKPVRKSIGRNKGEVDDYQDHVIMALHSDNDNLSSHEDSSSSEDNNYSSDNNTFLSNDSIHRDIADDSIGNKSETSSTVLIKKRIRQQRNKALIATIYLCMLAYSRSKYANLFQMVAGYFAFAQNMPKRYVEVFHKMGLLVTSETVYKALTANSEAVLQTLWERVRNKLLSRYYKKQLCVQKKEVDGQILPKYWKWRMPLKKMQCAVQAADILPLLTLPHDESKISGTIEILQEIVARLGLDPHILHDKKVMFKGDYMTVRNITRAIYCKQEEPKSEVADLLEAQQQKWPHVRQAPQTAPDWLKLCRQLIDQLSRKKERNICRENALLLTSCGLLYLDFVDACREGYSGRAEKCIKMFAILLQDSKSKNYAAESWLDYCLINISGRKSKFYADDRFGETIIKLNKKKVRPSSNAKSDEFLRETIALNVMSLWKSKEVLAQATSTTRHGSRHSVVDTTVDVDFLVKLLLEINIFDMQPGRGADRTEFKDLYTQGSIAINSDAPLQKYFSRARGRWEEHVADSGVRNQEEGDTDEDYYTNSEYQSDEF
ncbi:hypothetical protein MMC31_003867 [Peltigera leucophlebia]|nr:hypothetical protein [Peltigera leucophlebia]